MRQSRVTVVVNSYNHGHFLPAAINSLNGQWRRPDEVIVVDDGSTDDTASVVAQYPGVDYLYQQNQGLSAARNAGLRKSTGDFIVFLDADDVLEPCALEVAENHLTFHEDWALVAGGHRRVDADLKPIGTDCCWPVHVHHYKALLHGNYIGMHAAVMYRRAALLAVGGFDETLTACEDYDVYLRIARQYPIGSHSEIAALYRQHGANMSGRIENMLKLALKVHERQYPFVKDDPALLGAWKVGRRGWALYYGDQVLEQFRAQPGSVRTGPFLRVLRHYPFAWKYLRNFPLRPRRIIRGVRRRLQPAKPVIPPLVDLGSFRSSVPVGTADLENGVVGRYVERFLEAHAEERRGGLEIGPDAAPLESLGEMPDESQGCIVCVLPPGGFDLRAVVEQLWRVLQTGGVLLMVLPGVALAPFTDRPDDYWRFTASCARWLFGLYFPNALEVAHLGNAVTSLAALHKIPAESLTNEEYEPADSQHQLLVTVRARRS